MQIILVLDFNFLSVVPTKHIWAHTQNVSTCQTTKKYIILDIFNNNNK